MRYAILCLALIPLCVCAGCARADTELSAPFDATERMELRYAEQFAVDFDGEGRALVTIAGTERFLLVPDGAETPEMSDGVTVLPTPLKNIYVAASSAMDFFSRLDALDAVRFTSTSLSNWSLSPIRDAMEAGHLLYAGKYSAPDFELLLSEGCPLTVESTMIYHSPDIREQLKALDIPVLVERSSYESHPLGRMEWVKLYGLLTGKSAEADAFFTRQADAVEKILTEESTGKTAAFFSVSPNGYVTVRKPGDYVVKMMEMAGGHYVFSDLLPEEETALSTMNMQMEAFYAGARDADILIYNGAIDGGMETLEELFGKSELFMNFKAVKNGDVWRTERNLFQETTGVGGIIADLRAVFDGTADGETLTYLRRLR